MDRDMVIYAKGRPAKKIRDKDDKGQDYEEWIYGNPPEEVEFVRFQGAVVARLEIMTVGGEKIVRTEKEVDLKTADTEVAQKKPAGKPANAPTLLRPGEQEVYPQDSGTQTQPNPPYPPGSLVPPPPRERIRGPRRIGSRVSDVQSIWQPHARPFTLLR
jgi:hypothetical protein